MRRPLILVVDDEPAIIRLLRATLESDGFTVLVACRGEDALTIIDEERPDLVVLDVMMPGIDGIETLRRLRVTGPGASTPVIMLTARAADAEKLAGFRSGADDYVTKPFNPEELLARVHAIIRRATGVVSMSVRQTLTWDHLTIDLEQRRVVAAGNEVHLSRTEWALLRQLADNPGRLMLHAELLSSIWGPEFREEIHYLRTWVSRLRAKLEPDGGLPSIITTFPGVGYRLELPPGGPA